MDNFNSGSSGGGDRGERRSFGGRDGGRRSFGGGGGRSFGGSRGGFGRQSFGPREMHKAVCSDCKQECEVPFKPTEGKPVYCKNCFANHRKF